MSTPLSEVEESVKAGAIGGSAMVSRILVSAESMPIVTTCKRGLAAVITAWLANYYLMEKMESNGLRAAACGLIGMAAPELIEAGTRYVKLKANKIVDAEVPTKLKKIKRNGKRR